MTLYRLRNPDKPFKYITKKNGKRTKILDWIERIEIFDTFGFFQSSLVRAIEDMPGAVTPEELGIIKAGKKERGNFKGEDIEGIKTYTAHELKALVNMMNIVREALRNAIPDKPIELKRWQGAGSIAEALMELYLCGGKSGVETRKELRQMLGEFRGRKRRRKRAPRLGFASLFRRARRFGQARQSSRRNSRIRPVVGLSVIRGRTSQYERRPLGKGDQSDARASREREHGQHVPCQDACL